ncbi:MAG: hypothetical protein AB7V50_03235, partial [Vampirovibrionia bacterium]
EHFFDQLNEPVINNNKSENPEDNSGKINESTLPADNKRIVKDEVLNVPSTGGGRDINLSPDNKSNLSKKQQNTIDNFFDQYKGTKRYKVRTTKFKINITPSKKKLDEEDRKPP